MSENLGLNLTIKSGGLKEGVNDLDKVGKSGTKAEKSLHGMEKQTKATSSSFKALGVAGAAALTAIAGSAAISNILRSSKEYQGLNASLVTVTGSTKIAAQEFARISQFAKETPFQLAEVTSAFIKMESMGLKSSERALRSYGDTASSMSKSLNQMIEAVADAATGEFERLKEFGIRASSEGDRVSFTFKGITTTVGKNAAEIEDYLMKLGETNFAGGMARQMDTIGGKLSNLTDSWDRAFAAIGASQSGVIGESVGNLSMLADVVSRVFTEVSLLDDITKGQENFLNIDVEEIARVNGEMSDTEKTIDDLAKVVANIDNVVLAGLSTTLVTMIIPALWSTAAATNGVATALAAARIAALSFAATPIGAAITAAAIAATYLATRTTEAEEATDRLTQSLNEQNIVLSQSEFRQKAAELAEYSAQLEHLMGLKRGGAYDVLGVKEKELRRIIDLLLKGQDAFSTASDIVDEQNANFEKMIDTSIKKIGTLDQLFNLAEGEQAYMESRYNDTKAFRNKQIKAAEDASKAQLKIAKEQAEKERTLFEAMADAEEQAYQQKLAVAYARETIEFDNAKARQDYLSEIAKEEIEEQNEVIDKTREMIEAANEYGDAWTRTGNKAIDALNSMDTVMSKVNKKDLEYQEQMNEERAIGGEQTERFQKLEKARADNSVKGSMQMMAASVSMYEEGSDAQKAAHTAFMVMQAAELATTMSTMFADGIAGVVNQAKGDPYTAIPRMAAMAAMMGGLLSQVGVSFSGIGGGGSLSSAGMSAPDGTPLGSNEASESVTNTLELMNDLEADQYTELQGIYTEMKDLNRNITGVVSSLYATGDLTGLGAYAGSYEFAGQDILATLDGLNSAVNDLLGGPNGMMGMLTGIGGGLGDMLGGFASGIVEGISTGLFGSTSKSVAGYGAYLPSFALGDNVDLQKYTTIKKSKDGGWGRKSSRSYSDQYGDISGQSEVMMQRVFENMRDSMIGFGEILDMNVTSQVDSFVVSIGKIATKGKTAAEVEEAFSQAVSGQADKLAYSVFDNLINMYAKVNESAFDTVSRLGFEKVITEDILGMTGKRMVGDAIALSQSLVSIAGGIKELKSAADNYFEAFFSEQEQFDRLTEQLTSTLRNVNQALPDSREGYKALVEGLNLTTDAGQRAYVALLGASDQADEYYSNLEDAQNEIMQERISLLNDESVALSNNINQLEALYNVLESTFNQLVGSTTSSAAQYMTAQTVLSSALESARGGNLPGAGDISGTLSTLASNQPGGYATLADFKRDQLTTAGMINELMGYTDDQLTVEESMLNELARQTELLENIDVSTLTTGGVGSVSGIPLARPRPVTLASTQTNQPTTGDGVMRAMDRMWGELLNLRKDNQRQSEELVRYSRETSDTLDRWEAIGQPEVRV